ncbi:MAG: Coenzyme F420 hydrogenase/dehydrogenase, beta subunit C-terminal domain [Thermoguttaceae bacterium]|nr:Coenzyme F420 hydrogenase/dehydrogenase, beta subunit C-terminal domain [Thermoguttaceae bacterium]
MKIENLKNECTACAACAARCPKNCVEMRMDDEGFYFPVIDTKKCVHCGLCEKVCHCLNQKNAPNVRTSYCGFTQDDKTLNDSSSGGAFSALAGLVLRDGGAVYGAAFDYDDLLLKHCSSDEVGLGALRRSKYVESAVNAGVLRRIQDDLNAGRRVLFCGTPCQVSGLLQFIDDKEERLITVDFICHGVPSGRLFQEYLRAVCRKGKIRKVYFRNKFFDWGQHCLIVDSTAKTFIRNAPSDIFLQGFYKNVFLRRSCYRCRYKNVRRADITLADFWKWRDYDSTMNVKRGLSLIVANNERGRQLIEAMENFELTRIDNRYSEYAFYTDDCERSSLKREQFFEAYRRYGFKKAVFKTHLREDAGAVLKFYLKHGWKVLKIKRALRRSKHSL